MTRMVSDPAEVLPPVGGVQDARSASLGVPGLGNLPPNGKAACF